MAAVLGNGPFTINEWRVDPSLNRVSRGEEIVKIDPQDMKVLELLASKPGEVFSQAEIEQSAWPNVIVTSNSVYQSIAHLRRAFSDDKSKPKYIETIARKGYRCVADVQVPGSAEPVADEDKTEPLLRPPHTQKSIALATAASVVAVSILAIWLTMGKSNQHPTAKENKPHLVQPTIPASRLARAQLAVELGEAAAEARDMPTALRQYQIAVEEATGVYAPTDIFFADVFTKRAWIFQSQDDIDRALREAEAALDILEKNGVPNHPAFISARSVYAETLLGFGRYREAEQQGQEALRLGIALYGEGDLHVTLVRGSVARVRLMTGDWAGAETMFREVLAQFSARINDHTLDTVGFYRTLLAATLYHQGRLRAAASEAREALHTLENSVELGLRASAYQILSDALLSDGDIVGADEASRTCLQLLNAMATAPWRLARAESTRAEILFHRGRAEEARAKLIEAAAILSAEKDHFAKLAYAETERRLDLVNTDS